VNVTVAICTWNRAALLDRTLARMRDLAPPGVEWELLVVNNNSTDDTDAVIAKHAAALPLRRLLETKQGLSNARNCAIDNSRGELLVWTDDDVLVEPGWLAAYAKASAEYPGAAFFGGPVDPWFEVEPPAWVKRNLPLLDGPFALRHLGDVTRPFVGQETPYGANMAFRTAVLRKHRFDPRLGRIGNGMLSGEEVAVFEGIAADGGSGVWVASARVRHFIPAARLTTNYVWKFFHGLGRTAHRQRGADPRLPRLFGAERWAVRRYVAARARSLLLAPWGGADWLNSFTAAAVARGIMDESRAAARGPT
jgi:glycosyltransferase involved in cell wall biosynthesis